MNSNKATVAIVILLVVVAVFYERNQRREIQSSIASLSRERDDLGRQIKKLSQVVAESNRREPAPPPSTETPRVETAAPAALPARTEDIPTPGVTRTAPTGWSKNGSKPGAYVVGVDQTQSLGGLPSAYVKSVESSVDGFGGMMQMSSAEDFTGKRLRLTGWVKTQDANDGGGHLWFRVDGKQTGTSLQFDNMDNRPVKGTTDWQEYSVVLDVPPESTALAYGFFVQGTGQMWVNGAKIEEVGPEIPTTNMIANRPRALPKTPTNLNFN